MLSNRPNIRKITELEIVVPDTSYLDNGIPVYTINLGDQQASRIDILIEGGRCDESSLMESSFVAALLREGTASRSSAEIAESLDFYGAWLNCQASVHNITLTMYTTNRHFPHTVAVLHDLICHPAFTEKELSKLKKVTESQLLTNLEKVTYRAGIEFSRLYYGEDHRLGKIPSRQTINAINREMLQQFHRQWFTPENTTITLSGVVTQEMLQCVNRHFGKEWPNKGKQASSSDKPTAAFIPQTATVKKEGAVQSAVRIGIPAILRSHPDYIPLRILITAFGGYFGSRLMTNIREEKGYTYGISASLLGLRHNSYTLISSQCDNGYTNALVDEIRHEIQKLQEHPLSADEIERVRSYLLSDLAKTLDSPFFIADYYASMSSNHIPQNYFADQIKELNTVSAKKLQEMAQKYLNGENMLTVIVGDN